VGVTVDLELSETAGGHVKCWQRIAEAVAAGSEAVDLTVYFLGAEAGVIALGDRVRYRTVRARLGTRALGLGNTPGHTDLARRNRAIEPMLARHHVVHATAPFALSGSAAAVARRLGLPLAGSVHTDNPAFTRLYVGDVLASLAGGSAALQALARRLGVPALCAWAMARRVARGLGGAQHLFYSNRAQHDAFLRQYPRATRSRLRRGIDPAQFRPGLRDRARLAAELGIAPGRPVVAFAGRIDASKNADLVAAAAQALWAAGHDFTLLMLGEGALRATIARAGGPRAALPGLVPQRDLAWMLASADLFVFPSETETVGNVALEAQASGLPLFAMAGTAPAEAILRHGEDGFAVAGRAPEAWAAALAPLLADPGLVARHRRAAERAGAALPTWRDVAEKDLLPVWRALADRRHLTGPAGRGLEPAPAAAG
jgi:glycosyltransferase involved in cell wall biosynthesis